METKYYTFSLGAPRLHHPWPQAASRAPFPNSMRVTLIALGAIGCAMSLLALVHPTSELSLLGTTAGWVCLPLSVLVTGVAASLRIDPTLSLLIMTKDEEALLGLLEKDENLTPWDIHRILDLAARQDSTALTDKILERGVDVLFEEDGQSHTLKVALIHENRNVLTRILDRIYREKRDYPIFYELTDAISRALVLQNNEFASFLFKYLSNEQKQYCFQRQFTYTFIIEENTFRLSPAFWQKLDFFLDEGVNPFIEGSLLRTEFFKKEYFEKLSSRKTLYLPLSKECRDKQTAWEFVVFLNKQDNCNEQDQNGDTPLHLAVRYKDPLLTELLTLYADTSICNHAGLSPLQEVIMSEEDALLRAFFRNLEDKQRLEGMRIALKEGKEHAANYLFDTLKKHAKISYSIWSKLLQQSLAKGMQRLSLRLFHSLADVEVDERLCRSAAAGGLSECLDACCYEADGKLYFESVDAAIEHDNAAAIVRYLSISAAWGKNGFPTFEHALHLACLTLSSQSAHSVELLLNHVDPKESYALSWATFCGNEGALKVLLEDTPSLVHLSGLGIAVAHQRLGAAKILIERGADLAHVDQEGNTYLHQIAQSSFEIKEDKGSFLQLFRQDIQEDWPINFDHRRFCDYLTETEFDEYKLYFPESTYRQTTTDIVGQLPLELHTHFSSDFTAQELASFSLVSKKWYAFFAPALKVLRDLNLEENKHDSEDLMEIIYRQKITLTWT